MFHSMRRLGLVAAGIAAGLTLLSSASQALTISFTAQAFDPLVINTGGTGINTFYNGSGGQPTPSNVSGLLVNYSTSGLDYYVSKVVFDSSTSPSAKFVADGGSGTPLTLASIQLGETSTSPAAAAAITAPGPASGTTLTQDFAEGEFQQGAINGEFHFVQINNGSTVIIGHDHTLGTGDNTTTASADDLSMFNGTKVTLTFTLTTGGTPTTLGNSFTLSSNFAVQTTGQATDLAFRNTALAGNTVNAEIAVPEPGTLALFIGMGISGSGLLLRRRRR